MKKGTHFIKYLLPTVVTVLLWSCGPVARVLDVEGSAPASYPVNLNNKSISVFFSTGDHLSSSGDIISVNDSSFMGGMAGGIASKIEEELYLEEGAVFVFSHYPVTNDYEPGYIRELSFISNSDIIILLDSLVIGKPVYRSENAGGVSNGLMMSYAYAPIKSISKVYDGVSAQKIAQIEKSDTAYWEVVSRGDLRYESMAARVITSMPAIVPTLGENIASEFFPRWFEMKRQIYTFPGKAWEDAYYYATSFLWSEAMEIWLRLSEENEAVKVAAAAFNMAVACELTDRPKLALQWAQVSEKSYVLPGILSYKIYLTEKLETTQKQ